jgi:RNA polymerase sigma-70 factor (ECF subfamily)
MPLNPARTELTDDVIGFARAGDRLVMRLICDTLGPRLVAYARGQGVDDPDVIANETLYRVLSGLDGFTGTATGLRSWAFTIGHNLIVDEHRRRARRPVPGDEVELASMAAEVDVEATVAARVAMGQTLAAINELNDAQRDVLLLRHVADLSVAETADVLGKRPNAVKQLQHRATKALARNLAGSPVTRDGSAAFTRVS